MTESLSEEQRARLVDLVGERLFSQDCDAVVSAYRDFRRGMSVLAAGFPPAVVPEQSERRSE